MAVQSSTGDLSLNGVAVARGYSGRGAGKSNPALQTAPSIGPIPQGRYHIGAPFVHPHAGPFAMRLTPQRDTGTFGRSGFMIHADSMSHPGESSNGCIVLMPQVRQRIWGSHDHVIVVVP
ncbi:MAG: DUF2778 domain-containing protein [Telmatospirillum sp.]|nr:DUF2778 domain-containing protein [Telmatospirillum sp.]